MDVMLALTTLAHLLVLVYWLGGDVGAFVSSRIVSDPSKSAPARIAAAGVLANVDMAPRTALILAAPTGISLAVAKGWVALAGWHLAAVWIGSLAWLAIAWIIHLKHLPPSALLRRLDLWVRWLVIAKLAFLALWPAAIFGFGPLPLFLKLKCAILAACIGCGLAIRVLLAPFAPAFQALIRDGPSAAGDAAISASLARARPIVMLLWALLLAAVFLGLLQPT
jgi:hypothetical protein